MSHLREFSSSLSCRFIKINMKQVERSALLPHSAAQMFNVVNDVAAYADFLPWCDSSEVLATTDSDMTARLVIVKGGVKQSFTTRNVFESPARIELHLIDGPFTRLDGSWRFTPLGQDGCKVEMSLRFDFNSKLANLALGKVFEVAADTMVDAFCERADRIYTST